MPRKALENLTESMLYVLMVLGTAPMCGIEIADSIDTLTQGRLQPGPATLYTILGKFQQVGYIREVEVAGRKRTYAITSAGQQAYDQEVLRLQQCLQDAERIREAKR